MPNHDDEIRVLRVIEYTGKRHIVERTIERSIKEYSIPGMTIRAATLGTTAEILTLSQGDKSAERKES